MGRLIFINKPEFIKEYLKLQEWNDIIKVWVACILLVLYIILVILIGILLILK